MFRRITPQDRDVYLAFSRAFYASDAVLHPVDEAHFSRTFDALMSASPYADCLMLPDAVDGLPGGYALLSKTWSQEFGGVVVWLEELYVRPECRGQGLGGRLLAFLPTYCPEARCLRLEVEPENERASALYRRHGFVPLGYGSMVRELS